MQRSFGFSMVEVLVSLVILSIALLGTAGLMSSGLRSTNTAYFRSQATIMADDILDRMRANLTAAKNGNYDLDPGDSITLPATTMADYDCAEWLTTLAEIFPAGTGEVAYVGGEVTITISWDDGANSFTTVSRL